MSETFQEDLKFEVADEVSDTDQSLVLDIDGFEGPLHLLLELARQQRVDLARISILELADQYIRFIETAQDLRIELAADYLVMASWLAYLKSRLILPRTDAGEAMPEAEELAAHLAFRLQRLEAMRRAADGLFRLPQTGQQVHAFGQPAGLRSRTTPLYEAELFDMLKAYGDSRSRASFRSYTMPKPSVFSLEDARNRLKRALQALGIENTEWTALEALLPITDDISDDVPRDSVRASSLLAGLELAKEGELDLRQTGAFTPIFVRASERKNE